MLLDLTASMVSYHSW